MKNLLLSGNVEQFAALQGQQPKSPLQDKDSDLTQELRIFWVGVG